jgi:hypothetical protein
MKAKEITKLVENIVNEDTFRQVLDIFIRGARIRPTTDVVYTNKDGHSVTVKANKILNFIVKLPNTQQEKIKLDMNKLDYLGDDTGKFLRDVAKEYNIT